MMAVSVLGCHRLTAQSVFGIEYTTEIQTNFKDLNWVNLLKLKLSQTLYDHIRLEIGTISIAKTHSERLIDDLHIFSNIEEKSCLFHSP